MGEYFYVNHLNGRQSSLRSLQFGRSLAPSPLRSTRRNEICHPLTQPTTVMTL